MPDNMLNPGHGYILRESLGRGRWKEVYRAVSKRDWKDHALAVFLTEPSAEKLLDELKILHQVNERQMQNVTKIFGPFKGQDGRVYLAEELLYRSLESIAPVLNGEQFLRIARDLSNGLAELHDMTPPLVHRDLKLDNCGIDHGGRAKIFDLGSVTSAPGEVKGSILTRAPELFKEPKCLPETDVWALGGLLFALRSENYPFVTRKEATGRPKEEDEGARAKFEQAIEDRVHAPNAEKKLVDHLKEIFPQGGARDLIMAMLAFEPKKRPSAKDAAAAWESILRSLVTPGKLEKASTRQAKANEIFAHLKAVLQREVGMSPRQWEKIISDIEGLGGEDLGQAGEISDLQRRIKNLREVGELR